MFISLLFNSMFMYGYASHRPNMLISTIVSIRKNRKKIYINDSGYYREIALSSVLGKVLAWVNVMKRPYKLLICNLV